MAGFLFHLRLEEIRNNEKTKDLCDTYTSPHSASITTCWIDMTVMEKGQEMQRTWTLSVQDMSPNNLQKSMEQDMDPYKSDV